MSLKECTDDDIVKVEIFIREKWAAVMMKKKFDGEANKTGMVNYFGEFYWERPHKFEFAPGDKKLIKAFVTHVKQIFDLEEEEEALKHFTKRCQSNGIESKVLQKEMSIEQSISGIESDAAVKRTHYFLNKLIDAANQNQGRKPGGFRYDSKIKFFALFLRLLTGPLAYTTIQRNLECCLPSLPSVNRYISSSSCHILEGILRSDELCVYLNERNLPRAVSLSEDATRIVGRVQYDAKINQIIGFTLPLNENNGMPIPFSYPARNATEILKHFSVDNPTSTYLNVIMAQPLAEVPPFCLLVYGSDNKYTAKDVSNRWNFIKQELNSRNIEVISISADSDPRNNAAMRFLSKLGHKCDFADFIWFASGCLFWPFFIQDPTHIGTKLRNFLLRTLWNLRSLPFGRDNFIQLKHLYYLLDHFTKDKHELTASILNPIDKQNFRSVEKMCSVKVTNLLKTSVKNSQATVIFLESTRDVTEAFMRKDLTPLERVRKMWYRVFILRLWRRYILAHRNYSLDKNFLTSNCYSCIELNAHSLVQIIVYLRSINRPELFLPHLFGSQQCESVFRQLRSLTSTFSTVANCSTKEALSRLSKIHMLNEISHITSPDFKYPRLESKKNSLTVSPQLPTFDEIINEIEKFAIDAIETARELNLITKNDPAEYDLVEENFDILACRINPYSPKPTSKIAPKKTLIPKLLKLSNFDGLTLKNFSFTKNCIDEKSQFVELKFDNNTKRIVVKKSSFVWLLRKDWHRMSSDRLRRVQFTLKTENVANKITRETRSKRFKKRSHITRGKK